jgi:hypothetical protein
MTKAYPSNLTREQFELLNEVIPESKPGGRPREVDMWSVAIVCQIGVHPNLISAKSPLKYQFRVIFIIY